MLPTKKSAVRLLFVTVFVAIFIQPFTLLAQSPEDVDTQSVAFELEVIRLTNIERTSRGLPPLQLNADLTDAARGHNQDMITNNFFDHTGSDGSSPSERACAQGYAPYGWGACYVGENIAAGYTTPAAVVAGWMGSTGHRANILNSDYREIGVGHSTGGSWGNYWTMNLGSQPNVLPVFVNNDATETTARQVTIVLTKEDVSSWGSIGAITGVQISEDPNFTGASWQSWSQNISFTLSAGNGTKTVYVKFTDGSQELVSSDIIILNEPVPSLAVSPQSVTFLAEQGGTKIVPAVTWLNITNTGGDVLHWTASSNAWINLGSTGGDAPSTVSVSIDNTGGVLNSLGSVTGTITVEATNPDATNTPQTIPVTVFVVDEILEVHLPVVIK